jgi:hypothetical protein
MQGMIGNGPTGLVVANGAVDGFAESGGDGGSVRWALVG